MKVRDLIAKLQTFPQDAEAVIYDADESNLLRLDEGNVWFEKADPFYHFDRVEIGGCYDDRRIKQDPEAVKKAWEDFDKRFAR